MLILAALGTRDKVSPGRLLHLIQANPFGPQSAANPEQFLVDSVLPTN